MAPRIILFGDTFGIPMTLRALPSEWIAACVGAEIRPQQHAELRRLSETHHIPFFIQPRVSVQSYAAFVERMRDLHPDLILSNSYSMLIRPELLSIPRLGAVNIHGALLPQYRGCNPIQWALLNNDTETGATMHYMEAEFDAGDIITQRRVPIYIQDTWCEVLARIGKVTEEMIKEDVPKLLEQTNHRQAQDETKAHYYKRRHPEDGIIDWKQQSVLHVHNLIRALVKPHPGAFYYKGAEKVVLDQYLTISEVTALKYGEVGEQTLYKKGIQLVPTRRVERLVEVERQAGEKPLSTISLDPATVMIEGKERTFTFQRNDVVTFEIQFPHWNNIVGFVMLRGINFTFGSAELHIRLAASLEGNQENAVQLIRLAIRFAFDDLNLIRLYLHIDSANSDVQRVFESVGFVRERLLQRAAYMNGQVIDLLSMGILREEFRRESDGIQAG